MNHEREASEAIYFPIAKDEFGSPALSAREENYAPDRSPGHAFARNRSSRLAPAHQGMKSWSCGLVRRIGTADSATPLLRPSGGQAPRLA